MGKRGFAETHEKHLETPNKRLKYDTFHSNSPALDQNFVLNKEIVDGAVMTDIKNNRWRVGKPFGKGSFGEIFLASNNVKHAVTSTNANYVVKIEPHNSGPLFVEIHCLLNAGRATENSPLPPGMPEYIASGSHTFNSQRYRFLVLPRYKFDLHSIIKNRCIDERNLLIIAIQTLDVLEHLHGRGYVHADIKAANMMIGACTPKTFKKEYELSDDEDDYQSDFDQSASVQLMNKQFNSSHDNSLLKSSSPWSRPRLRNNVEFSGTNPIRSCRMSRKTSVYDDMLNLHYLRPHKKIDYSLCDDDDDYENDQRNTSANKDEDFEANSYYNKVYSKKSENERKKIFSTSLDTTEDRIFLIDFGLALKYLDSKGNHKPFCMDERRAHDGTLEFTSRDAHMGAHSRRSDLECLGYNLIFWSQGWLPWENEKLLTQPEQVHRFKEHFMTDVKEMLKQMYGENVPAYLSQFLDYVDELAYHEPPDYDYCRRIFKNALNKTGLERNDFKIDLNMLKKNPRCTMKDEIKKRNSKLKNVKDLLNIALLLPARENGSAKISPKNLRSKSDKIPKKQRKKFSWTDVLNSDPDQIAKQRAEKEYENDQRDTPLVVKYAGKPNYAILRLENRLKFKDRLDIKEDDEENSDNEIKPDLDNIRKRKSIQMLREVVKNLDGNCSNGSDAIRRRKSGLRRVIRVPSKCVSYRETLSKKRRGNSEFTPTDESTCSSSNSSMKDVHMSMSSASDEDSRDTTDYSPIKTRVKAKPLGGTKRMLKKKSIRNVRTSRKIQRDEQLKRINTRSG